jgi:hypothetical protein
MFKPRLRLPSPALVIAMVALALVLGGTAVAASTSTPLTRKTGTKLIKKLAPTLSVKNANQLGGQPASSYEAKSSLMWAAVTNDGTTGAVARSSGGITASRSGTGSVIVTFPTNVSGCGWTATQGNPASSYVNPYFATVRGDGTNTHVWVLTYDSTGAYVDANFHILVTC